MKKLIKYALNNLYYKYHNGCTYTYEKISHKEAEELYLDWVNNFTTINRFSERHRMTTKDANKFINDYREIRDILNNHQLKTQNG